MEKIILGGTEKHPTDKAVIDDSQHGFVKGKSCLSNLISFYDKATHLVDQGKPIDIIFLDFSKAFNTVSPRILLDKLSNPQLDKHIMLWEEPIENPDLELFTDGSSFVKDGKQMAGYTVVTATEIAEVRSLPVKTSTPKPEIIALKQALNLAAGKRVNIWTDSGYAFGVIHAHGVIWTERGLLSAQGSAIKHKEEILKLLEEIKKPKEVAVMHFKAHPSGKTVIERNQLADKAAGGVVEKGILVLVSQNQIDISEFKPNYDREV
ncbi:hypothetical protein TURU_008467 [Turdus rufiventris]|nr:hypothetical protein TURU_008467 [Turdus rufiventris]